MQDYLVSRRCVKYRHVFSNSKCSCKYYLSKQRTTQASDDYKYKFNGKSFLSRNKISATLIQLSMCMCMNLQPTLRSSAGDRRWNHATSKILVCKDFGFPHQFGIKAFNPLRYSFPKMKLMRN